ncbi:Elongation factor 1-gamma 1 [Beauveria bassiana]|uniref:Elongation factor 1-gamma 1 n=1 Tax=Beauveria bassiana TaxID=176275 RepID=A0A2N6NHM7_BEABA|nr:Elongation factor 1-gamma 1 [Beauveria bassiana]
MEYTVYGYEAHSQDIKVNLSEVVPRQNLNRDALIEKFPRSRGKIPALEGDEVKLTEVPAIAYPGRLLGDGSLEQEAEVLSWVNWANQELLIIMSKWFLPLIPGLARPAPYDQAAVEAGKAATLAFLDNHEAAIKDKKFLVGNDFTLADIFVAVYISRGLEWILGDEWRRQHPATMKHFDLVANWEHCKAVVPVFKQVDVEVANSNQLLGARRVNGDAAVKVGLCGAHLDGDAKTLEHLAAAETQDVQADNLFLGAGGDELVAGRALVFLLHHGVVHGREARLVDLDIVLAVLFNGLRLAEANAADLGVGKDDRGDVVVVELGGGELLAAKQAVREFAASGNGNGGQLDFACGVAKGVDIVDAAVLVLVHLNVARVVELDASFFQTDTASLRGTADGPNQVVDIAKRGLVARIILLSIGALFNLAGIGLLVQLDSQTLVLLGDGLLDHGVKVTKERVVADKQMRLGAERVEHASEFDGNVAGTDDGDLFRLSSNVKEVVRVDAELSAGDGGRRCRLAANSDENLLGVDEDLGVIVESDLDLILGHEAAAAVKIFDLVVAEIALINAIEALDVSVALLLKGIPIKGRRVLDGEAVGLGVVDGLGNGGGVEGDLFRNASSEKTVPPRRLFSMTMALTSNLELAMRAEARPPLPPPRTR